MDPDVKELLEKKFEAKQSTQHDAMSYASVAAYVQNQQDMVLSGRRHEAQVDALLKVNYAECGYPDAYKPPEAEDDMGSTLINCTFNGDDSIAQMSQAISNVAESGKQPEKPDPVKQEPSVVVVPPPPKGSRVPKWLLPIAGAAMGAGLTFAAASYFGGDDANTQNVYDMVAVPYYPNQIDDK